MEKIQDYGMIGNGRSVALVSRHGSIDWLCWPRFESPSLFAGILDSHHGGFWKIHPTRPSRVERKYLEETNILETHFFTESGHLIVTDFMTAFSEEEKIKQLHPEHELIRHVRCAQGEVEIEILFNPRPDYGRLKGALENKERLGLRLSLGQELISLQSPIPFELEDSQGATALTTLKAGEILNFSLTYTREGPAVIPPVDSSYVSYKLSKTKEWWQNWADRAQYQGPHRNYVVRSALALKLLGYAPSGAFVASGTTSLPERLGGDLNWDYRYCWLRDASFAVRSLLGLGYTEEAEAFVNWMLHSTRLTLPKLRVAYDVFGRRMKKETELSHLAGYENSRPVRIGNAAGDQFQLDVYGEVVDAVYFFIQSGGVLDKDGKKMTRLIGKYVCENWRRKDSGIWEERVDLEDYTHSRLMCWVALDKVLRLQEELGLKKSDIKKFEENRSLIRNEIEEFGWNEEIKSYSSYLHGKQVDASLILMPSFEFENPSSPRMKQTFERIEKNLSAGSGLVYRYERSVNQEGAFLLCSFWKIDFLARGGCCFEEASQEFKNLLKYANDLGLFSEEIDPNTKDFLGNFPQAFTHIGLINAALLLKEREKHELG